MMFAANSNRQKLICGTVFSHHCMEVTVSLFRRHSRIIDVAEACRKIFGYLFITQSLSTGGFAQRLFNSSN